ncbi:MAG TPA: SMP-30/gluconolactonase/LRE family protein [Thermoanaerobaculia bacterium]|nr:SMP-30/gluconolactonase/LRE family protein [Thermoanaerobaculia bacterium]
MNRLLCAVALALSLPAAGQPAKSPEIQRLEEMLQTAPDHGGLWLAMATAQAKAGNKVEAFQWLEKAVDRGLDFDLPDEPALAQLREMPGAKELLARAAVSNRRVVNRGRVAFRIPEKDLIPEGIAHDPETGAFYVGSLYKRKIVRIDKAGKASDFTASGQDGIWDVLGLKVDPARRTLWACSGAGPSAGELDGTSSLFRYDLATGKYLGRYDLPGRPHLCNDIALGKDGELFFTDSKGGILYRLRPQDAEYRMETLAGPGTFIYPNGIAISPDLSKLFVADFKNGLSIVDVSTGQVRPLPHPERVHVAGIDGLYFHRGSLIAVQNSAGTDRVVRFRLNAALDAIESEEVLESRNPLFDIPTTGVLAGGALAVIANSQLDSVDGHGHLKSGVELTEPVILEIPVD